MTAGALGEPVLVGPYRLVNRLGEGGMGVVHLALDPQDRPVALKVLRAHVAADPDARRRLAREVETLLRVRHPNVAQVLDADLDAEVPYLVTTFVPGRSLEEHVREHGPLSADHVAHVGRRIASALSAIHRVGVVHRDLKPANVMLLDGEPVVIDFGIAHMVDESRITMTGLVMGTPGYLSPEIVDGQPVTPATDWWGWGATLAFAASGRPPFGAGTATAVLDRVRRGACDLSGVDARLAGVIAAALVVDPARRAPAEVLLEGLGGLGSWTPWHPPAVRALRWGAEDPDAVATAPDAAGAVPDAVVTVPDAAPVVPPVAVPPVDREARTMVDAVPPVDREARTMVDAVPPAHRHARTVSDAAHPPTMIDPRPQAPTALDAVRPGYAVPGYPPPAPAQPVAPQHVQPSGQPPSVAPPGLDDVDAAPRTGLVPLALLAGLAAVGALATVVPGVAVAVSLLWLVAMRTVDRTVVGLLRRRYARGPRSSDSAATVAALPGRLLASIGVTFLAGVIPALMGVSAAFLTASAVNPDHPVPNRPGPLLVGMVGAWLAAWWGPGSGSVRRGSRLTVRVLVSSRPGRIVFFVAVAFVVLACVLVALNPRHGAPDWSPLR